MTNWTNSTLGLIADFTNGGAWSQDEYTADGVRVVRVSDVKDGTIDLSDCKYLAHSSLPRYRKNLLKAGDLIVCTVGSHPTQPGSVVGRAATVPRFAAGTLLNQNAVCVRPSCPEIDAGWLGFLGKSKTFHQFIMGCARGAASQVRMPIGILKEMPVSYPPLPTQRRIASILSAYDDLIENNTRRIAILEEMARRIYEEWFVRFRFPGHGNVPMVESEIGLKPMSWALTSIESVTNTLSRGPTLSYIEDGIPVLNQRCVRGGEISLEAIQRAKPLPDKKNHLYLANFDILINSMGVGTLGRVSRNLSIVDTMIVHNCITLVRANPARCSQAYLYYVLSGRQGEFESIAVGATGQTSLPIAFLKELAFTLPPQELMSEFDRFVFPMWKQIGILKRSIRKLRASRDLLLPKLISGELDVSEMPEPEAAAA
jgi:type I restriction enzyme S subunit